jgi:hypothetical protein
MSSSCRAAGGFARSACRREHLATTLAAERGAFGSPTFIVGDDVFFGNDRLDFLEERLHQNPFQKRNRRQLIQGMSGGFVHHE